jgi:pimeloyl-ACP methyl ester carboxylesterase
MREVMGQLEAIDVEQTLANPQNKLSGYELVNERKLDNYTIKHYIEDGIEHIVYTPKEQRYETPILMQHGMWHGAWCWQQWQELFAEWGWQSIAISLPGHANSPLQKPMTEITLDYYLAFLRDEMAKFDSPPILMGHSMGGAISQWYLRYVSNDLPAVVLVGSWVYADAQQDGVSRFLQLDPIGVMMTFWTRTAEQYMRSPKIAAKLLISDHCIYTPEELHKKLGSESGIVMMQHNPPFWKPADSIRAPLLYVAGEKDAVVSIEGGRCTAEHYKGDFILVPDCAHNIMMDAHYKETAQQIHDWLQKQSIA